MLKGINLTDKISVPTQRTMTDAGQMIVPCAFARTGVQLYKGSSLGLTDQADEMIEVHRTEEVVFDESSMESFRSAPVTIGHPKDDDGKNISVTADNAKDLQVGMLEGMPTRDEDTLTGTLVIANKEAIDTIEEGTVELSAGYTCDIEMIDGVYHQSNIKANHIAIVDKGRAGSNCAIADEDDTKDEEVSDGKEEEVTDEADAEVNKQEDLTEDAKEVPEESKSSIKDVDPAEMKAISDSVEAKEEVTDAMSEAEAAEAVAGYEESESEYDNENAMYLKEAAENADAWAKAHAEVAKAARKIANKKAKSVNDSAEEGGDTYLADDVTALLVHLDVQDEKIVELQGVIDTMDEAIVKRSDAIVIAKTMTDLDDFAGKSVNEIKKMVVADRLDIDLSEKSDAYIEARFEILCEDSSPESQMGNVLKASLTTDTTVKKVNIVADARQRMINRNLNK